MLITLTIGYILSIGPLLGSVCVGRSVCLSVVKSKQFLVDDLSAINVVKTNITDARSVSRSYFPYSIFSDTFHDT